VAMLDRDRVIRRMEAAVGSEGVISERKQLRTYECDGLKQFRSVPALAVLPESSEQVRRVVQICYEEGVPFVARGAGTGLSGGALPIEGGVLIVLSRMREIIDIDLPNQRMVVEPGVLNNQISDAISSEGYHYAPDPSSQVCCSIGGNVAENSGGAHCFKYGVTTNHVTGLEVVLPDGEMVHLGGKAPDPPGYDLVGTFVGSEGTLGIATKVTVRVIPQTEAWNTLMAAFASIDEAAKVVSSIIASGVTPAAIELMDRLAIDAAEAAVHASYPEDAGALLIVELDGPKAEVESEFGKIEAFCQEGGSTEIQIARNAEERMLIWKGRKAAFAAVGWLSPDYYVQDGTIPRSKLSEVLGKIGALSEKYGLRVANVFHAGDGNLHPLILYNEDVEGEAERAEKLAGEAIIACLEAGGSITGEHGVGADKKKYLHKMFGPGDLKAMKLLRAAFDPHQLCNPGKIFPDGYEDIGADEKAEEAEAEYSRPEAGMAGAR
jgi:glycolate oxidase